MVKPHLPPSSPRPPQPPRSGAGRLPAAARKEAILTAALPLFATRGSEGTTTRDLAKAAGVTEPILYRHFPSKADLFAAVVTRATERVLAGIDGIVRPTRGASARLVALASRLDDLLGGFDLELRVLNGAAATHADLATTSLVRDAYGRIGAALSRALEGGGLRRGVSPTLAGHLLLEVGLGAALARPLRVAAVADGDYGRQVLALLVSALTGKA